MKDLFSSVMVLLSSSTTVRREFRFVPYGQAFDATSDAEPRPTISCDGRIPGGVSLELTHWTGNDTPDSLYADTSTGMALKLAAQPQSDHQDDLNHALVLNNHYDTDGVLSCWACLHPELVLPYKPLLIHGAEAGDFGEWPSDDGLKLNAIVENMCEGDEQAAYATVFDKLPHILQDLTENQGTKYKALWEADLEQAKASLVDFEQGKIKLSQGPGKIVLVQERDDRAMDTHALHKALVETNLWEGTTRILRYNDSSGRYRYDKIGHGWVQKLVDRHMVPNADANHIVHGLNAMHDDVDDVWKTGGSGLTAICQSSKPVASSPQEVLDQLHALDEGSR